MATLSPLEGRVAFSPCKERRERWLWPPVLLWKGEVPSPTLKEKGEVAMAAPSPLEGRGDIPFLYGEEVGHVESPPF